MSLGSTLSKIGSNIKKVANLSPESADIISDFVTNALPTAAIGLSATVIAANGLDQFNRSRDRVESGRQQAMQKRNYKKELENYPQLVEKAMNWQVALDPNLELPDVIGMYNNRNGHSTTWGGKQY